MKKARILLLIMLLTFTLSGSASTAAETEEYNEHKFGDFTYTVGQSGNAEITGYRGDDRDLRVPSEVDGHPVTSLGVWAFGDCYGLVSVTPPDSVTLPDSLVSISGNPFVGFPDLAGVRLSPDHPVFALIDGVLFNHADKVLVAYPKAGKPEDYTVPPGTKSIGNEAFSGCAGLVSIVLPDGLESISDFAFTGCVKLACVTLPEGLQSLGANAFSDCTSLSSATLPGGASIHR